MKILCIIPCYKAESTLKEAIESILKQSYTNWELVIVDDASPDKSYKIAQSYSKKYPNITVLKNHTNQGCYYSRNRALYHMKDKEWNVFTIHDADDTSTHDRFKIYVDTFLTYPKLSVVVGIFNGIRCNPWRGPQPRYYKEGEATGTNWYKRDIFKTFGYFDDTRFAGDSEYTERITEFLTRILPEDKTPREFRNEVMQKLDLKYSYTYTTGFHPQGNLTQNYKKPERVEYKSQYTEKHQNWREPEEFYTSFEPSPEDIIL